MKLSLTDVTLVTLPVAVAKRTHGHLFATGINGLEGIALWAGTQEGSVFHIREVIVPQQQGIRGDHGVAVMVPGSELQRINLYLYRNKLRLLAQIHSHPTQAFHSEMDDECAIATALGSFSLVVPDFARNPFSFARCAIYRLTPPPSWKLSKRPQWTQVDARAASAIFNIVDV
jgi:hypothetical protein